MTGIPVTAGQNSQKRPRTVMSFPPGRGHNRYRETPPSRAAHHTGAQLMRCRQALRTGSVNPQHQSAGVWNLIQVLTKNQDNWRIRLQLNSDGPSWGIGLCTITHSPIPHHKQASDSPLITEPLLSLHSLTRVPTDLVISYFQRVPDPQSIGILNRVR